MIQYPHTLSCEVPWEKLLLGHNIWKRDYFAEQWPVTYDAQLCALATSIVHNQTFRFPQAAGTLGSNLAPNLIILFYFPPYFFIFPSPLLIVYHRTTHVNSISHALGHIGVHLGGIQPASSHKPLWTGARGGTQDAARLGGSLPRTHPWHLG